MLPTSNVKVNVTWSCLCAMFKAFYLQT